MLFFRPKIRKSVNDDTKNEIQQNDNDHKVEKEIVQDTSSVKGFLEKKL